MNYGRLSLAATELPWLGMAYVAAAARLAGHTIKLADHAAFRQNYDDVRRGLADFKPDVVAMTCFINNIDRCFTVAEIAKQVDLNTKVILGGPIICVLQKVHSYGHPRDVIIDREMLFAMCALRESIYGSGKYPRQASG